MAIGDRQKALIYLERIGYYRLSAYWYPFRQFDIVQDAKSNKLAVKASDAFHRDTHFLDAVNLYLFDKKLRLLVLDALERIEVAVRVDIAYLLGQRDAFAYKSRSELHPKFTANKQKSGQGAFDRWQQKYADLLRKSREDFVRHHHNKYGFNVDFPIWVAIEIWDFGALSQLFAMMKIGDQEKIARKYAVDDFKVFASWLRSLNYLRNIVAHHSRLWNRNMIDQPKLPKAGAIPWCDEFIGKSDAIAKPFLLLAIIRHIVQIICPNTEWQLRIKEHLAAFPVAESSKKRSIKDMGVTIDWERWWN